ncbi:uncharacterized protein EKO05_0008457 [Ascochyta rabiei]|uniref:uncharacterized protein n=1 Tax=Didymella rabiei TaxID=5454 RepID=UPI0021FCD7C0|nr:uncharacterized protein EKO05_0008457 [Ascochyta rabiei]UPX18146.1 hypothetical protein EKO05_0008457 [Ascochyta rabiei]
MPNLHSLTPGKRRRSALEMAATITAKSYPGAKEPNRRVSGFGAVVEFTSITTEGIHFVTIRIGPLLACSLLEKTDCASN